MPVKLTYEHVKETFEKNGCKLLTTEYVNGKQKLEFRALCGHNEKMLFDNFKRSKSKKCSKCRRKPNKELVYTFEKTRLLMETRYEKTLKYRDDFLPENYDKQLTCWDCKKTKNRRVFPYRKQYADNKEKRCKKCNCLNHIKRKENYSKDQIIGVMLKSAELSSKKREARGRDCQFSITKEDIMKLVKKQDNKCIYTGREFGWTYKHLNKPSIDRINSSKGYTKDNIQLVVFQANQAKSDMTHEEFINFVKEIYSFIVA